MANFLYIKWILSYTGYSLQFIIIQYYTVYNPNHFSARTSSMFRVGENEKKELTLSHFEPFRYFSFC
jgi:hypothetical protein